MNWLYIIIGALLVSTVCALVLGAVLSGANPTAGEGTYPLTAEHRGCAVLEVRDGPYPVVALLPTSSHEPGGRVSTGADVSMVHVSLQGDDTGGVAAVLRAAEETGHRVDVKTTSFSDDISRRVVRRVNVSVAGGGASVQLTDSAPYAEAV